MKHRMFFFPVLALVCLLTLPGCDKDNAAERVATTPAPQKIQQLDIGVEHLIRDAELTTTVRPRSHGGYIATARGRGTIPSGEYAGWRFTIDLEGAYSDIGLETLESGSVIVRLRSERYVSVYDPVLSSFCCGNGHLFFEDDEYTFVVHGQVSHTTAPEPHNHLFAGLATTARTMNMNIADQSGTVVIPVDPPHDPGIGLLIDFDGNPVQVEPH